MHLDEFPDFAIAASRWQRLKRNMFALTAFPVHTNNSLDAAWILNYLSNIDVELRTVT